MVFRRHRIKIAVAFTCASFVAAGVWISSLQKNDFDPRYNGSSLSTWMVVLDDGCAVRGVPFGDYRPKTTEQMEAVAAIRAIGTNALPRLLHDLDSEDSRGAAFLRKTKIWCSDKLHSSDNASVQPTSADRTRWQAAQAIDALGTNARGALPQLVALFNANTNTDKCKDIAYAIAGIGPEGLAVLTNFSASRRSMAYCSIIWAIGQHPEQSTNLIPWLFDRYKGRPIGFPYEIWAVCQIHSDPAFAVPALIQLIDHPNSYLVGYTGYWAIFALGRYGPAASNAVPRLRSLTNTSAFGAVALKALEKIQPGESRK